VSCHGDHDPGKGGASPSSQLFETWAIGWAAPAQARSLLGAALSRPHLSRRVRDVDRGADQRLKPELLRYSVIQRLVGVVAGAAKP